MKLLIAVILSCLLSAPSFGAFNSTAIWRTSTVSGSGTNGGAYDPGVASPGTDESTGAGVAITVTLATGTTGTCSPVCSATTHGPGNFINIASGSGCTTGTFEILSQAAGTITVDHSMGSATDACVGRIGGPLASPVTAVGQMVGGNTVCIKADGTYTVSSQMVPPAGTVNAPTTLQGYTSTCPTNDGGQATLASGTTSFYLINGPAYQNIFNLILNCASQTGASALTIAGDESNLNNVLIENCPANGFYIASGNGHTITNSRVTGGTGCNTAFYFSGSVALTGVVSDTNGCLGFYVGSGVNFVCTFCIAANNTGATTDGFQFANANAVGVVVTNSASYGNGRDGFRFTSVQGLPGSTLKNNYAYGNTGKSFNSSAGSVTLNTMHVDYNAYTSGSLNNISAGPHDVTLTGDPTVAGASLNFSLNETAGAGGALRGTGFPNGSFFGSTAYTTIGPIQPLVNSTATLGGGASAFVQ